MLLEKNGNVGNAEIKIITFVIKPGWKFTTIVYQNSNKTLSHETACQFINTTR